MAKVFETSQMSPPEVFKLLVGMIVPRPIGWISTVSAEGLPNLAPFSFFNMLSNNPATLVFSAAISRDGRRKDSLLNAEATKCFVHNVVTRKVCDVMNETSEEYPHGVSEFEKVGLTALPSLHVAAPRVKEAVVNIECRVSRVLSLGDQPGNGQLVFGEVLVVHVNDETLLDEQGLIRSDALDVVARLGRNDYLDFGSLKTLRPPKSRDR